MKFHVLALVLGLSLWSGAAPAQDAAPRQRVIVTEDTNICESEKFKLIIDAIQCVAKNCPELNDEKKKIYEDRCTVGGRLIREHAGTKEMEAVYVDYERVNQLERVVVAEEAPPEQPKLLPPCECLAKLKERFVKCEIELCKPEEPKQPGQTPDTPKEVTPDTPKEQTGPKQFLFEGSGCSLNAATGLSAFGGWALVLAIPAALASRRKKK